MLIKLLHHLSIIPIVGVLFRMLLIAITGESRHMPNERDAVVPRKLLIGRIIRTLCFILFVAVAFTGYQLIRPEKRNQPAEEIRETESGSIESPVAIEDTKDLDKLYSSLRLEPEDILTIRIDKLRKRIKIGENMSKSKDETARVKGEYYSVVSHNSVALTYLQVDEPVDKATRLALAEYTQSGSLDEATERHIAVARVLVELNIMLHGQQESKAENQFASSFEEAANLASSDVLAATTLFQIVKLLESQPANAILTIATEHGYRSLAKNFVASENRAIAQIGKQSHEASITYDLSIPTIEQGAERSLQRKQVNEAIQRIKEFTGKGNVNIFAWQPITQTIDTVMRTGHVQSASALIEFCDNKFRSDNPETAEKFAAISKWVPQFGRQLSLRSLRDVEDNQVSLIDVGRCRILIFAAPNTTTLTGEKLDPILKLGQEKIKALGITISIVYCGDDISNDIQPNHLLGQQEMATKSDFLDVWIVDTKNNTEFFLEYPMVDRPFVLMLDESKRIVAVDPTPFEFDRQVSLLTLNAEKQLQE